MSEELDIEAIRARNAVLNAAKGHYAPWLNVTADGSSAVVTEYSIVADIDALLAEVERLRAENTRLLVDAIRTGREP